MTRSASLAAALLLLCGVTGCVPTAPATTASPSASSAPAQSAHPTPSPVVVASSAPADPGPVEADPADFAFVTIDPAIVDQIGGAPDGVHFVVPEESLGCSILTSSGDVRWGCVRDGGPWPVQVPDPDPAFCVASQPCLANAVRAVGDEAPEALVAGDIILPVQYAFSGSAAIATLPVGQRVSFGGVSCTREAAGVSCERLTSGHGFTASGGDLTWW